jgi:hypothetical protein
MKLYTEEQVMNALKLAHSHITSLQNIIDRHLTPIELPSDEEINKEALNYITYSGFTGFTTCAVWFRDEIIKRNDNQ